MFQYDVFQNGCAVGRAEVAADGLYWQVQMRCRPAKEAVVRASAENVCARAGLGVLMPEGGEMVLSRRLARSGFSFYPDTYMTLDAAPRWQEFSSRAAGYCLPGARVCRNKDGGATVLLLVDEAKPFACMPLFCFFALSARNGAQFWQLELSADGEPRMPQNGEVSAVTGSENEILC